MGILDDYQNLNGEQGVEESAMDRANMRRKRADLERQIVILESDLKKTIREIEEMEGQKRKFKKEEERIRIDRAELDKNLEKLKNNQTLLEEEIRGLKKKLKSLIGG
jgi:chromosome segregation ATPase